MFLAQKRKGFTLIELLVVIAIIATLAVVVFVALNPVRRFKESRNATRATEINEILTAIHEYIVDNDGALPATIDTAAGTIAESTFYMIGTGGVGCVATLPPAGAWACSDATVAVADCVDLATDLTGAAGYLASMPVDPTAATYSDAGTGFVVRVDAGGIITVQACGVEDVDGGGPEPTPILKVSR